MNIEKFLQESDILMKKAKKDKSLMNDILSKTVFLDVRYKKVRIKQRLFHILFNINDLQKCKQCNNIVNWNDATKMYRTYCGPKCAHNDSEVRQQIENTCLVKYGSTTNLNTEDSKHKKKQTCMKKYGTEYASSSEVVKDKIKNTFLQKYGVTNAMYVPEFVEKISTTNMERYGYKTKNQQHIPQEIIDLRNDKSFMEFLHHTEKLSISAIAELLDLNVSQLYIHFVNNLNIKIRRHGVSQIEKSICQFLNYHNVRYVQNNREILQPQEIDIFLPEYDIGIEVDGLYWHSDKFKDKLYHYNKQKLANSNNIKLIHITDYEWNNKQELVKSRIKSMLGKNHRLYARKCTIVTNIDKPESIQFLNQCHIQGHTLSSITIGLKHHDELVAIMTFGKSRFNKKVEYELIRYCCKQDYNVIGGANKLFKHFIKHYNPKSIISYCDVRWNKGTLYKILGFDFIKWNKPNYWYSKNGTTFENRMNYQKHKLSSVLQHYDDNLSEYQNMTNNKFYRYWDCGNQVWVWMTNK